MLNIVENSSFQSMFSQVFLALNLTSALNEKVSPNVHFSEVPWYEKSLKPLV